MMSQQEEEERLWDANSIPCWREYRKNGGSRQSMLMVSGFFYLR
jgi:hypothetical protein